MLSIAEFEERVRAASQGHRPLLVFAQFEEILTLFEDAVAMGAAGATVSSETADAVITVDRIDRVADAVHTGRRALRG